MFNDWGGPIGLWVACQRPERVRAFVMGNTWAWPADARMRQFSRAFGGPLGDFLVKRLNVFLNVFVARGPGRRRPTPREMAAYRGPFPTPQSRQPVRVFPREIAASGEWLAEVERRLPVLRDKPALLTWADKDPGFGERERVRLESTFPRRRTVILKGAGHHIQDDAPDEIADAMLAWWREEVEPS